MVARLPELGIDHPCAAQGSYRKRRQDNGEPLGSEVLFSCEQHQASFEQLTERKKKYIECYMRTGSPTAVAKEMGLSGSPKGVGKRLKQIAKEMGLDGVRDLRPPKESEAIATATDLRARIAKQKYRCALSGVKLVPETASLDHIEPLADGGTNEASNLQWLDKKVNRAKGTMSQSEFIQMCCDVARHAGLGGIKNKQILPGGGLGSSDGSN